MSFYIFTATDGVHYQHDDDPVSVTVVDNAMKSVGAVFKPLAEDYACEESFVAGAFILGYWQTADLQVFDLRTGDKRASFPFRKVTMPMLDNTGRKLLFKSASRVLLLDLETGKTTTIKGLLALDRYVAMKDQNELIVPSQKKGELLRVSHYTGAVSAIPVAIDATFFDVKPNPATGALVLIDRRKGVHCLDPKTWNLVWSVSLKKELGRDHMGVGQFSGDGKLFGAAVSAYDHNYTLVLDARNGNVARRIEGICYGLPWKGTWVRHDSTNKNTFVATALDLATGDPAEVCIA